MGILNIRDIPLYRSLQKRDTDNAVQYAGLICQTAADMDAFLQYIKKLFPAYPDHGFQHSMRILRSISELLGQERIEKLTQTELFCLILAALFHDTAMALYNHEKPERLRANHAEHANIVISKYFKDKLCGLSSPDRIEAVVQFAARGHGRKIEELYRDPCFKKKDAIDYSPTRYGLVAVLLRLGDLLDMDSSRVNPFVLSEFGDSYGEVSLNHNVRHLNTRSYYVDPYKIAVEVQADSIEQYDIWDSWFNYLAREIEYANTYLDCPDFRFPGAETKILQPSGAGYSVEKIRFEIDEAGGIWNILSHSIYTDKLDFLRELIQNAIDASLAVTYRDTDVEIEHPSPRSWDIMGPNAGILVGYSAKRNQLYIADRGTGMDLDDLSRFLFKVTGSGYQAYDARGFAFPAIAKFGIGFVSCLINANRIELYTKKQNTEYLYQVSLKADTNTALIQKEIAEIGSGTTIVLNLKSELTCAQIMQYIKKTFRYPSVGITCVDVDEMETLAQKLHVGIPGHTLEQKPYTIHALTEQLEGKRRTIMQPLQKEIRQQDLMMSGMVGLSDWLKRLQTDTSDSAKFKAFQKKVTKLAQMMHDQRLKAQFPVELHTLTEKALFEKRDAYLQRVEEYIQQLSDSIGADKETLAGYPVFATEIANRQEKVCFGVEWNYFVIFVDEKLRAYDVQVSKAPIDLKGKTGILFYRQEFVDYNKGVELEAINGVLFNKGEICDYICSIPRDKKMEGHEVHDRNDRLVIGGTGSMDDLAYTVEEYFWERAEDLENNEDCLIRYQDGTYDVGAVYEKTMDILQLRSGVVYMAEDVLESEIYVSEGSSTVRGIENLWQLGMVGDIDSSVEVAYETLIKDMKSVYCQDGIALPCAIEALFPVGFFRVVCNCTGDARMALNVTRHKISELKQDVTRWTEGVGNKIQSALIDGLTAAAEQCGLYAELGAFDLYIPKGQDVLVKSCAEEFSKLVQK